MHTPFKLRVLDGSRSQQDMSLKDVPDDCGSEQHVASPPRIRPPPCAWRQSNANTNRSSVKRRADIRGLLDTAPGSINIRMSTMLALLQPPLRRASSRMLMESQTSIKV